MKICASLLVTWTFLLGSFIAPCETRIGLSVGLAASPELDVDREKERAASAPILVIKNITVVDGTNSAPRPNMVIIISDRRILEVRSSRKFRVPRNARVVDGTGKYAIPGLWDMHVHLSEPSELTLLLSNGITSVRDMGSDIKKIGAWRDAIASGRMLGPTIKTAGPILESSAELKDLRDRGTPEEVLTWRVAVSNPGSAKSVVESLAHRGVDFIKARSYASVETYKAIASESRKVGLMFVGHPPFGLDIDPEVVADAGQRTLEHGFFPYQTDKLKPEDRERIKRAYVRNGTVLVPTLIAWEWRQSPLKSAVELQSAGQCQNISASIRRKLVSLWSQNLKDRRSESPNGQESERTLGVWRSVLETNYRDLAGLRKGGVRIMPGTDEPPFVCPDGALAEELALFVERLGMTPLEALQSVTSLPADLFGMGDAVGTIVAGKRADIVVLTASPLTNIRNLRLVHAVVVGGAYHRTEQLRRHLQG